MSDAQTDEQAISYAYQCGKEDGSRLERDMDDADVTKLGIDRGEQWAAAALGGGPYPERL